MCGGWLATVRRLAPSPRAAPRRFDALTDPIQGDTLHLRSGWRAIDAIRTIEPAEVHQPDGWRGGVAARRGGGAGDAGVGYVDIGDQSHYLTGEVRRSDQARTSRGHLKRLGLTRMCRTVCAILVAFLMLGGCTRQEATARLIGDIPAETLEIIHVRFPCHSPDLHFFGYRFRVKVNGESGDGDICWNFSTQQWTWRILRDYPLSRLNPRD
jgi:hypothetical protein